MKLFFSFCFRSIILLSVFIIEGKTSYSQLIISQYYEGASNDKCIEIYNTTNSAINLAGYNIKIYSNGSSSASATINLSGTISACGTFVLCNSSYNSATVGYTANQTSGSVSFNGDDAVGLYNGTTLLDLIGDIGCDPGSEWTGVSPGTEDGNFVRNSAYCTGVTTDPSGACGVGSFTTFTSANWTSFPLSGGTNLGSHTSSCCGCSGPVTQPTTETTADTVNVFCTSATITWTASTTADNVIVVISTAAIGSTPSDGTAYTANSTYGSGETIGANQYVVYNGSGTSVTVTGLTTGTTYYYAIFGYDGTVPDCEENYLTGGNFGSFTITCTSAQITSLIVNSCNGGAEGTDELIVIQNGSDPIDIDDMYLDLPNSDWCNSGCGANTLVNNPTYVSDLNAMAGCIPDLFVYSNPIPAGATVMIFTGDPPSTVLDYSANCGAPGAPIYVIFMNNSSTTGNFVNSGAVTKIIEIDFGNGQTDSVTYYADDVDGNDGGSVNYDAAGNPTYYTSNNCVYPLSARLAYFDAALLQNQVELNWATYSYQDIKSFQIERSVNGTNFEIVGEIPLNGNSDAFEKFTWTDFSLSKNDQLFYRLRMESFDQKILYSEIILIEPFVQYATYSNNQILFFMDETELISGDVYIYSANGSLIQTINLNDSKQISFHHKGLYFLSIPEKNLILKLVCF